MESRHPAQIDVARMGAPQGDLAVQGFFDALDAVNPRAAFRARLPSPGVAAPPVDMNPDRWCVGTA